MSNPQRGQVPVILAGRERTIRLTTNAIARAEELLGHSLLNGDPRVFGFREARVMLFVGLNDKDLTLDQVGDLMDESEPTQVIAAVLKAFELQLFRGGKTNGAAEGATPADPQNASPGTGNATLSSPPALV